MKKYQFTHDGLIIVQNGAVQYVDTPQALALDAGEAVIGAPGLVFTVNGPQCSISATGDQGPHGLTPAQITRAQSLIDQAGALVAAQSARKAAAEAAAIAALTVESRRALEYNKAGVTVEALAVALFELQVEGRPEAAQALQAKRAQVKAAFPK